MPFNNLKRFAFFSILLLASSVVFSAQGSVNGSGATYSTPIEIIPVYSAFIPEKTGVIGQSGLGANQSIVRDANSAYSLATVISTPLHSNHKCKWRIKQYSLYWILGCPHRSNRC